MIAAFARTALLAFVILTAACATSPRAPDTRTAVHIERTDKAFDIPAGITRIAINNPWGEINMRSRDEREVGIHAVVQRTAPRFADMKLTSRREGATLRIDVVFPDAASAGRADIAVYVPNKFALALSTRGSRIAAKKWRGTIEATSDSGEIQASSYGRLSLRSASGQIRAVAIGANWDGASEIRTDSGRIVLLVPTFGNIALEAETGGKLSTGFGLSVHERPDGRHEAHARYGAGTSPLRAQSTSGEIVLEQLVLVGDDKQLPEDDD